VSTPQILCKLVRIKQRRVDQFTAARDAARSAEQHAVEVQHAAQQREDACRQAEQVHRDKVDALSGAARFLPSDLVTMAMIGDTLAAETRGAKSGTAQAQQAVETAHDHTVHAMMTLQRAEQQAQRVQERLGQVLVALVNADDDAQDEDAEEAAVSRMLARDRAAAAKQGAW
jgi:hypothetical protein